jgi:hypothetical protein
MAFKRVIIWRVGPLFWLLCIVMKNSVVINCIAGIFFALSAIVLFLGTYTLYWPTTGAEIEYYKSERVYITAPLTDSQPRGGTLRKLPADILVTLYSYQVDGISYSSTRLCYCFAVGMPKRDYPPKYAQISYFPSNPKYSVLIKGPDVFLVFMLSMSGVIIFFGWRFLISYFVKNA